MTTTGKQLMSLPDGRAAAIAVRSQTFRPWTGAMPARTYGSKPVVEWNGEGVFPEIAAVQLWREAGWDAAWVSTYGGLRFFADQPSADRANTVALPDHVMARLEAIAKANHGWAGSFDVVAWREQELRFVELKRRGHDRIRDTQRRWLSTALDCGHDPDAFQILEWDFDRPAIDSSPPPSAIGRLLDEISWEGNARKYRDGGIGKENVLTVEVFTALNLLPRSHFLGEVLNHARGADAARESLVRDIEDAAVDVLPGDVRPVLPSGEEATWTVQPDATISTPDNFCLVEAKRLRASTFQPQRLARLGATVAHLGTFQQAFCLLVLAEDPPVHVRGRGRLTLSDAIRLDDEKARESDPELTEQQFAVITWDEIATIAATQTSRFTNADTSVESTVSRLAKEITDSVTRHR